MKSVDVARNLTRPPLSCLSLTPPPPSLQNWMPEDWDDDPGMSALKETDIMVRGPFH